jgi:peptidoglycan/LPS O-acetylase OafA/YrhL
MTLKSKPIHLNGLNGIRAIAAIAVVISHITLSLGEFNLNPFIFGATPEGTPGGLNLANYGVTMFFALSGFLITYLLLKEQEKRRTVDVKKFYIRRILRIHPLYFAYLLICLLVITSTKTVFVPQSIFYYIFFLPNMPFILGTSLPFLAHYWSLGVEEQFYIAYPWIIKKIEKIGFFLISLTLLLIALKVTVRIIDAHYDGYSFIYLLLSVCRFQCMLIGALGAIYYYRQNKKFINFSTALLTQIVCWIIIGLITFNRFHIASVLDNEIVSVVTTFIILGQITKRNLIFNLDLKPFDFLGKISYGIYVIHPLIIFALSKLLSDLNLPILLNYLIVYASVLGVTILTAYLSYEYFEKRFLSLKNRYSVVETSTTKYD